MPPHEHMVQCLKAIFSDWKGFDVTFMFRDEVNPVSGYGEFTKSVTEVPAEAIGSPVNDVKDWMPEGLMPDSDLQIIVWEVTDGTTDYLTNEYFTSGNCLNMWVRIGSIKYRVLSIRSPETILSQIPYWVVLLRKLETSR
jgi:hypothetical protein